MSRPKGFKLTKETKKKIGRAMKIAAKFNKNRWSGGDYNYWHVRAKRLFGFDYCEECYISERDSVKKYNRRLHMHCEGGQYKKMKRLLWTTLCVSCHRKLHCLL